MSLSTCCCMKACTLSENKRAISHGMSRQVRSATPVRSRAFCARASTSGQARWLVSSAVRVRNRLGMPCWSTMASKSCSLALWYAGEPGTLAGTSCRAASFRWSASEPLELILRCFSRQVYSTDSPTPLTSVATASTYSTQGVAQKIGCKPLILSEYAICHTDVDDSVIYMDAPEQRLWYRHLSVMHAQPCEVVTSLF